MARHSGDTLGISFINGILSAELLQHGRAVGCWEHPEPIVEESDLSVILASIPGKLEFRGYKVSMIIAAPPVEYHILPVPAMKKRELVRFCKWKTESLKDTPHVWSYTRLKMTNQKGSVCLHLMPSVYQALFIDFCKKSRLEPYHLLTIPAVVSGLLEKPDESDGKLEMVAFATDRVVYFVIGTRNAPLFIRELSFAWNSVEGGGAAQFAREIKRTILFIKRQFGKDIGTVKVRGPELSTASADFAELDSVTLQLDKTDVGLLETVVATTCYRTDNLLPVDMLGSHNRLQRTKVMGTAIAVFGGTLVGMAIFTSMLSKSTARQISESNVRTELASLQDSIGQYNRRIDSIRADFQTGRFIRQECSAPVPGLLTGYIADKLPNELVITRMVTSFNREIRCWNVEIEGYCPPGLLRAADALEQFGKRLEAMPVRMKMVEPWNIQWLVNLQNGGGDPADPYSRRFRISGSIQ